jgi:hypothetical protein
MCIRYSVATFILATQGRLFSFHQIRVRYDWWILWCATLYFSTFVGGEQHKHFHIWAIWISLCPLSLVSPSTTFIIRRPTQLLGTTTATNLTRHAEHTKGINLSGMVPTRLISHYTLWASCADWSPTLKILILSICYQFVMLKYQQKYWWIRATQIISINYTASWAKEQFGLRTLHLTFFYSAYLWYLERSKNEILQKLQRPEVGPVLGLTPMYRCIHQYNPGCQARKYQHEQVLVNIVWILSET